VDGRYPEDSSNGHSFSAGQEGPPEVEGGLFGKEEKQILLGAISTRKAESDGF